MPHRQAQLLLHRLHPFCFCLYMFASSYVLLLIIWNTQVSHLHSLNHSSYFLIPIISHVPTNQSYSSNWSFLVLSHSRWVRFLKIPFLFPLILFSITCWRFPHTIYLCKVILRLSSQYSIVIHSQFILPSKILQSKENWIQLELIFSSLTDICTISSHCHPFLRWKSWLVQIKESSIWRDPHFFTILALLPPLCVCVCIIYTRTR